MSESVRTIIIVLTLIFMSYVLYLLILAFMNKKPYTKPNILKDNRAVFFCIFAAIISRLILLIAANRLLGGGLPLTTTWHYWDAQQYIDIVNFGYLNTGDDIARLVFFPLFPWTIKAVNLIVNNPWTSALIVSWTCLCICCVFLYKLIALDSSSRAAARGVKYLLIFPFAVFLGAPFTESMFLMFSVLCIYSARRSRFGISALFGALAALTRNLGVLLVFVVMLEVMEDSGFLDKNKMGFIQKIKGLFPKILWIFIVPIGSLIYLALNYIVAGDAFAFMELQAKYWYQDIGFIGETLATSMGSIFVSTTSANLVLWIPQTLVIIFSLCIMPYIVKKTRLSYAIFSLLYLWFALSPTWLLSGGRYLLGMITLYPILASFTKTKWFDITLSLLFGLLMLYFLYGYTYGYTIM